jgi:hypothetical protein
MTRINANRMGLVVAVMMVAAHAVWLLVVATGAGQAFSDFVLRAHLVEPDTAVLPFTLPAAGTLLLMAAATGYVIGGGGALVWNGLTWLATHEWSRPTALAQRPAKTAR